MPDSKVFATLIICFALVASTIIYTKKDYFFGQKAVSPAVSQAEVVVDSSTSNTQPVNDGWKKMLTTTIGSNDPIVVVAGKDTTSTQDDNTLTAQISKEFFSLYLQDKKNGVAIDANEAQAIADQTLSNVQVTSVATQYTGKDIKISADSSDPAMAAYEKALINAVTASSLKSNPDVLTIVNKGIQSENDSDLAPLDPIIKSYQAAIKSDLAIQVPQKAVPDHLIYLNTMSRLLYDIQGLRNILTDPLMSYVAFTNFQKDTAMLVSIVNTMNVDFAK